MSSPLNVILSETFVSDGVSQQLPDLPGEVERIIITDVSNVNTPANNEFVEASWTIGQDNGTAIVRSYTGAAPATDVAVVSANGVSILDPSVAEFAGALTAATAVSQAAPAVVSLPDTTGLSNGDTILITNTTGMNQIGGMEFTISGLIANTSFELSFLDSAAFAAAATNGIVRRRNRLPEFTPRRLLITNMSQAAQMIVTISVTHDYVVGELIRLVVPAEFGMVEANDLRAEVVAIGAADGSGFTNTITLDIDSSAFTAFAFPASAAVPFTFPQVVPFGDDNQASLAATNNISAFQVTLGSAVVGTAGDTIQVMLFSGTSI